MFSFLGATNKKPALTRGRRVLRYAVVDCLFEYSNGAGLFAFFAVRDLEFDAITVIE
jgi:hypothetical protein